MGKLKTAVKTATGIALVGAALALPPRAEAKGNREKPAPTNGKQTEIVYAADGVNITAAESANGEGFSAENAVREPVRSRNFTFNEIKDTTTDFAAKQEWVTKHLQDSLRNMEKRSSGEFNSLTQDKEKFIETWKLERNATMRDAAARDLPFIDEAQEFAEAMNFIFSGHTDKNDRDNKALGKNKYIERIQAETNMAYSVDSHRRYGTELEPLRLAKNAVGNFHWYLNHFGLLDYEKQDLIGVYMEWQKWDSFDKGYGRGSDITNVALREFLKLKDPEKYAEVSSESRFVTGWISPETMDRNITLPAGFDSIIGLCRDVYELDGKIAAFRDLGYNVTLPELTAEKAQKDITPQPPTQGGAQPYAHSEAQEDRQRAQNGERQAQADKPQMHDGVGLHY